MTTEPSFTITETFTTITDTEMSTSTTFNEISTEPSITSTETVTTITASEAADRSNEILTMKHKLKRITALKRLLRKLAENI